MTDARLEHLSPEACLQFLRETSVGRVAFVAADQALVVLPVNYRLAEPESGPLIAVRTRPGNVIDNAPPDVVFEIDSIDPIHHEGWSVVVRGEILHAFPESRSFDDGYDPEPWLADRDAWLLIDPSSITGRELRGSEAQWDIHHGGYL